MRAVDLASIEQGHATGETLMERAGLSVVDMLERRHGSLIALNVLVLCGSGNNGGDGFVAARYLHARGACVQVALVVARDAVQGDALTHRTLLEANGVRVESCESTAALASLVTSRTWDHALDAMLGTGARGAPRAMIAAGCESLNLLRDRGTLVTAVDLPTGVDADTGEVWPGAVHAHLTVSFGAPKRGHVLYPGRAWVGELEVVDIGLLPSALENVSAVALATPEAMAGLLAPRDPRAHKGTAGRVVITGGAAGLTGAVVLAAQAASRAGAGYVRVCAPASVQDVLACHLVEQMVVACGEGPRRALTTSATEQILAEAARADAVAIGPGLSRHRYALELVRDLLPRINTPVVIDADALFALSPASQWLSAARLGTTAPRILTPHVLEMERLTGIPSEQIEAQRIDVAAHWAQQWNCVVVLKGAPTVIASPTGETQVNTTGNPGMASAGMGDVLTGVIAALCAQGIAAFDAARLAVFVHGLAGDMAQLELGETGLIARDVIERLPRAMQVVRESR